MAVLTPGTTERAHKTTQLAVAGAESVEGSTSATNPRWWRNFYAERNAHHELGGERPRAEAERLAYGECIARWHLLFGKRWPSWRCAACDQPIEGMPALTLFDENRVHFDDKLNCLSRYGKRWRGGAAANLRKLGIDPPKGFEE
jgi:hypothetical protein